MFSPITQNSQQAIMAQILGNPQLMAQVAAQGSQGSQPSMLGAMPPQQQQPQRPPVPVPAQPPMGQMMPGPQPNLMGGQ